MTDTSLLDLTVREIAVALPSLTDDELIALREAETAGKTRKTVVEAIDAELAARAPESEAEAEPEAEPDIDAETESALPPHVSEPPPVLPEGEAVTLREAELQIISADYSGEACEIRVGAARFSGTGQTREAAYLSAVGAWLASEGKALA